MHKITHVIILQDLDLSGNKLRVVPTYLEESVNRLRFLNLSGNRLQEILGTPALPSVETLDLSHNLFQILSINSISKLPKLKKLFLNDNPMEVLSDAGLTADLQLVNLDRTLLHSVPFSLILSLNQENSELSIKNMSIHCDCRVVGLQEYLRLKQNDSAVPCSSPPELVGVPVINATLGKACERPRSAAAKLLEEKTVLELRAARSGSAIVLSWNSKMPLDIFTFGLSVVYENKSIHAPKAHIPYYVNSYSVPDLSYSIMYKTCIQAYDSDGKQVGSAACKLVKLGSLESTSACVTISGSFMISILSSCIVALFSYGFSGG